MRVVVPCVVWLAAVACGPTAASVITEPGVIDDTGDPDGDTDADTDVDTDTDTDVDTDTDTEPPDPVYRLWEGSRSFDFGRCEADVFETGVLVEGGRELQQACPSCELFYELDVGPDRLCGIPVRTPAFRGLELGGRGSLTVWNLVITDNGWQSEVLATGFYDGNRERIELEYDYDGFVGRNPYEAEGEATLIAD